MSQQQKPNRPQQQNQQRQAQPAPTVEQKQPVEQGVDPANEQGGEQGDVQENVQSEVVEVIVRAQPEAPVQQTAPSPDQGLDLNQRVIVSYLREYEQVMSAQILTNDALARGAQLFADAVARVLGQPDTKTLDIFTSFMRSHADGLMSERLALRGISTISPAHRARIEILYGLIRMHLKEDRSRIDRKMAVELLGLPVVEYYTKK